MRAWARREGGPRREMGERPCGYLSGRSGQSEDLLLEFSVFTRCWRLRVSIPLFFFRAYIRVVPLGPNVAQQCPPVKFGIGEKLAGC